jgi:general secretion pathway protein I
MKSNGFTLLEVMISMMIVALALGSSFGLLAGSRQLAIRAAEQIEESLFLRSMLNASQVEKEPSYPKLPEIYVKRVELDAEDELKPPARQTQKIQIVLEPYTLRDEDRNLEYTGLRWKKLELSR